MKTIKYILTAVVSGILVMCAAPAGAFAATYGYSLVVVNYDSFEISYTGEYTLNNASYSAWANLNGTSASGSDEAYLESSTQESWAWGETTASDAADGYGDLYIEAQDTSVDSGTYALASASYEGVIQAVTSGTLTLSVDYYLSFDVMGSDDYVSVVNALISLALGDMEVSDSLIYSSLDGITSYDYTSDWSTLVLTCNLNANDLVAFSITGTSYGNTTSAVPVPGSCLILSSGLLALAAFRRK